MAQGIYWNIEGKELTTRQAAAELGVSASALSSWRRQYGEETAIELSQLSKKDRVEHLREMMGCDRDRFNDEADLPPAATGFDFLFQTVKSWASHGMNAAEIEAKLKQSDLRYMI